jgi:hypothetical protein
VLLLAKLHAAVHYVFKNINVDEFSFLDLTEPSNTFSSSQVLIMLHGLTGA